MALARREIAVPPAVAAVRLARRRGGAATVARRRRRRVGVTRAIARLRNARRGTAAAGSGSAAGSGALVPRPRAAARGSRGAGPARAVVRHADADLISVVRGLGRARRSGGARLLAGAARRSTEAAALELGAGAAAVAVVVGQALSALAQIGPAARAEVARTGRHDAARSVGGVPRGAASRPASDARDDECPDLENQPTYGDFHFDNAMSGAPRVDLQKRHKLVTLGGEPPTFVRAGGSFVPRLQERVEFTPEVTTTARPRAGM